MVHRPHELAGTYSTNKSGTFINGVLGAIAEEARPEGIPEVD